MALEDEIAEQYEAPFDPRTSRPIGRRQVLAAMSVIRAAREFEAWAETQPVRKLKDALAEWDALTEERTKG